MFRVLGSDLIIENALKNIKKMARKSEKYVIKKAMALTIVMVFYGFVQGSEYTSNYTKTRQMARKSEINV